MSAPACRASSWTDVIDLDALRCCTRCELATTRQRVVVGSGPARAKLMIVGEAPGREEDEGGEPFIGRSGRLLFELLGEIDVLRADCFVTNVVKCRPPANRTPRPGEITTCAPWLVQQLADCAPRVVLALGNTAARNVLGFSENMGRIHGRVCDVGGAQGVATYHPAAALRGGARVVDAMRVDLRIVQGLLEGA